MKDVWSLVFSFRALYGAPSCSRAMYSLLIVTGMKNGKTLLMKVGWENTKGPLLLRPWPPIQVSQYEVHGQTA